PARHGRDDAVDGGLGEPCQGDELGGDWCEPGGDAVGRYREVGGFAGRCGEGSKRGGGEQSVDIAGKAVAADAVDERDGEEGVTAEGEEVVASSNALEAEQLGPDIGQCLLDGSLRGLVGHGGERGGIGSGRALRSSLPFWVSGNWSR